MPDVQADAQASKAWLPWQGPHQVLRTVIWLLELVVFAGTLVALVGFDAPWLTMAAGVFIASVLGVVRAWLSPPGSSRFHGLPDGLAALFWLFVLCIFLAGRALR